MNLLIDVATGFFSGLLIAISGAIKDSPYEGFEVTKFIRSPIIGAIEAPILGKIFSEPNPVLLGLSTIATERITIEIYKLIRGSQGKYKPMKFTYGEWCIPKRARRKVAIVVLINVVLITAFGIADYLTLAQLGDFLSSHAHGDGEITRLSFYWNFLFGSHVHLDKYFSDYDHTHHYTHVVYNVPAYLFFLIIIVNLMAICAILRHQSQNEITSRTRNST